MLLYLAGLVARNSRALASAASSPAPAHRLALLAALHAPEGAARYARRQAWLALYWLASCCMVELAPIRVDGEGRRPWAVGAGTQCGEGKACRCLVASWTGWEVPGVYALPHAGARGMRL